nr:MBL fold metallo-hydrolase [Saprospiraceae bacterium]
MFELTFLGTGTSQGVPVIGCDCDVCKSENSRDKRLRTSALIRTPDQTLVIDVGPDFRQQMLREKVENIDAVLLTHEHNDHIIGLDDVRPYNFMQRKGIDIYGTERVMKEVKLRFPYVFDANPYPGAPSVDIHLIKPFEEFFVKNMKILSLPVLHGSWPVMAFKMGPVVYITDARYIEDEVIDAVKGCEVLVLNTLRKKSHHSHLSLEQGIEMSQKIGAKSTYFTHISHTMGSHEVVTRELPDNIHLAYDGLKVSL